jgi:uncharacterized protein YozE (UPF0346 family)
MLTDFGKKSANFVNIIIIFVENQAKFVKNYAKFTWFGCFLRGLGDK